MKKNVGGIDRLFRFGVGFLSLMLIFLTHDLALQMVFGFVALVGLGTAATGYCPINDTLGLDTTVKKEK